MIQQFTYSHFLSRFPTDEECLEEFKKLRYPSGIFCEKCMIKSKHYKLKNRFVYACKYCRTQISPLSGTILEKTTTPLRKWFFAIFILTHTRAEISIAELQRELGVTYKTAWKMYKNIRFFMEQNNGDLLTEPENNMRRWTLFSKFEITVKQKQESIEAI